MDILRFPDELHDEVFYVENIERLPEEAASRIDYNAAVFCQSGRLQVEIGEGQQVEAHKGQLMLIPSNKLLRNMMVSTDLKMGAMFISDRVLKSVLGPQINIWNQAMYLNQTHIVNGDWVGSMKIFAQRLCMAEHLKLKKELLLSFLRMVLLLVCEDLLRQGGEQPDEATDRDKVVFNNFLKLIAAQQQKRQRVSFYASELSITPKYLSTICKRVSGKSPRQWITESVMEDIFLLLKEKDLNIKQISDRLGFPNSSFFGQFFREQTGQTPADYRARHYQRF